jgi:hypothetical protein
MEWSLEFNLEWSLESLLKSILPLKDQTLAALMLSKSPSISTVQEGAGWLFFYHKPIISVLIISEKIRLPSFAKQ